MFRTHAIRLLTLTLATTAATAQSTLHELFGDQEAGQAGSSIAGGADLDQDGWADVVVATPFQDTGALTAAGRVQAFSGRDGTLLWTKFGLASDDYFGSDVALAGDVDGDGIQDVIAGAWNGRNPNTGLRTGYAKVYSGPTGALIHALYGAAGEQFGWSVGGGLDWNLDGRSEVVVGSPNALAGRGNIQVYSGATGNMVIQQTTFFPGARLGEAVWARSDLDGDGFRDIVTGGPLAGAAAEGVVSVFSGASLLMLWEQPGTVAGGRLGSSVTAGADGDGDGRDDVIVGAPGDDTIAAGAGSVRMLSGLDGDPLNAWFGGGADEDFGSAVAVVGDVDSDGVRDFAVGAPQFLSGPGYARLISGQTGLELFTVTGRETGDLFGGGLSGAGDVNNDGKLDLLVSAPLAEEPGGAEVGSTRVFSAAGPGIVSYCTAGASSSGCQARITAVGVPSATASSGFQLRATGVEGGKNGIFFYGANGRQANPWGNGASLQCVVPPVKRGGLVSGTGTAGSCDGAFSLDLNARWCPTCPKPSHSFGAGAVVQAQLWYRDPQNTSNQTTSLSDAVEFVVQP